ncbi:MAG: extracellular solute-binding protein [Acholeplasmataceae bacterium]
MKKVFLIVFLLLPVVLFSCDNNNNDDVITISYAAWNLGNAEDYNIERRMINAFMVEHPDVVIDVLERPRIVDEDGNEVDSSWDEFFATRASIGKMPDVFQVDSVIKTIEQEWVEDLSEFVNSDEDYLKMPEDIRNSAKFGDKVFALPQAMFYFGFFINRTAINNVGPGAVIPEYGISYQDLMEAAKKNSKAAIVGGDGIAGISGLHSLYEWLPAQYDENLGWFTYNEEGYHLDSDAFRIAMTEQQKYFGENKSLYEDYVLETQDNQEDRYGEGDVFVNGKQSIRFEGSYNIRDWVSFTKDEKHALYGQDIDFIGTPSVTVDGKQNHRIPIVMDYIGVGKGTKHKEVAFEFAKWMGYGVEGYLKRLEIAKNNPKAGAVNFPPLVKDETLIEQYFNLYPTLTEYRKIVETHEDFIIESLAKVVPGYVKSRWEGKYSTEKTIAVILDEIRDGNFSLTDALEAGLNDLINDEYNNAKAELERILNK